MKTLWQHRGINTPPVIQAYSLPLHTIQRQRIKLRKSINKDAKASYLCIHSQSQNDK